MNKFKRQNTIISMLSQELDNIKSILPQRNSVTAQQLLFSLSNSDSEVLD